MKAFLTHSAAVFEKGTSAAAARDREHLIQALDAQIGELKVAKDFFKRKLP
jgi:hypothetical protein